MKCFPVPILIFPQQNKGGEYMKRFITVILSLVMVFSLIACSNTNGDKNVQLFKTENIKRILFYNDTTLEEVEVPEEYLDEIITWLESFTIDKEVEKDKLEPGSDAYCVQIEYEDGTIVKNGLWIYEMDGKQYYTKGADTPECWQDIFENQSVKYDLPLMVMIDGELYTNTGDDSDRPSTAEYDGKITSEVSGTEFPTKNDQSNFGVGYPYIKVTGKENTVEILVNGVWRIFDTNDKDIPNPKVNNNYKNSFVGKVLEETTSYMIVEPIEDKADGDMGEKVKVEYGTDHYDYLFGKGRMVVIYFEGKPEETNDGMKLVKSDDISTEGFREFELEVEPSTEKQKKIVLSGDDIQSFVSFGHMSDTNLYYYGIDKVLITIKGFTMPLETALEKGRRTLDGIVAKCNKDVMNGTLEELVYKDGGSQVYKYPEYTIIKYHTIDGNRDVYIGSTDMDIHIADK